MPIPDISWVRIYNERTRFPNPATASSAFQPIAKGGDLSPAMLLAAYSLGIFPWFMPGEPLFWWSPNPRCVLYPDDFKLPRRSLRFLRNSRFEITLNKCFSGVIDGCAAPRSYSSDTWISADIRESYIRLHELGYAHSVETWLDGQLIGGLYGVALGRVFFGESMFHTFKEGSRAALMGTTALLKKYNFHFMDCQNPTDNLEDMGARAISRKQFLRELNEAIRFDEGERSIIPLRPGEWRAAAKNLLSS
ncbi:MAG: leucyl/phenylalanyl-tRNA--protein transferase [Desulfovibrio sp.]|nr:leucyl/phenylalanyl-tRNA--protein transferase [Desulfovibrio sp.]